ncbi:hypothetical protein [Caulobacter sp. FWC2]|uniref:hypothetical protein n=1 Tax=Caulobacter sp. FWC2 TaxID=69664 RepID=UPI000C1560EF|nr:hypothetical protein [Caulobacter sp. FWC2]PIB93087.1 hypothetical protein CSW62_16785 [Caulobacter sp. FWC2]
MIKQLFFFHNPKAGGTSVATALAGLFEAEQRCPRIENDAVEHAAHRGRYGAYRGYDYYGGHYGRDIQQAIGPAMACVTNFRWPVARVISLYRYFRHVVEITDAEAADPRFRSVVLAKILTMDDYVTCDDPAVRIHTCDHHFRQLTGSGWSGAVEGELGQAMDLIDHMPWFFVAEHAYESMIWAESAFDGRLAAIDRLNETQAPEAARQLGRRAYQKLDGQNQFDLALYRYAVDRLLDLISPSLRLSA